MRRATRTDVPYSFTERIDMIDQQAAAAFEQIDGKEVCPSGNAMAGNLAWGQCARE